MRRIIISRASATVTAQKQRQRPSFIANGRNLLASSSSYSALHNSSRATYGTMATARNVRVTPENTGLLRVPQTPEAASKTSELVQADLDVGFSH